MVVVAVVTGMSGLVAARAHTRYAARVVVCDAANESADHSLMSCGGANLLSLLLVAAAACLWVVGALCLCTFAYQITHPQFTLFAAKRHSRTRSRSRSRSRSSRSRSGGGGSGHVSHRSAQPEGDSPDGGTDPSAR